MCKMKIGSVLPTEHEAEMRKRSDSSREKGKRQRVSAGRFALFSRRDAHSGAYLDIKWKLSCDPPWLHKGSWEMENSSAAHIAPLVKKKKGCGSKGGGDRRQGLGYEACLLAAAEELSVWVSAKEQTAADQKGKQAEEEWVELTELLHPWNGNLALLVGGGRSMSAPCHSRHLYLGINPSTRPLETDSHLSQQQAP